MPVLERPGGAKLHFEVSGRNHSPPLLLLNGLGTDLEMWRDQTAALERYFRVIRYDVQGHGKSTVAEPPPATRSIDDLATDALAVLDAARAERAHWCGLSLGGMTAMAAAVRAPQRVLRLVLANTSAYLPPTDMWNARIATVQQQGMEPIAAATAERWFTPEYRAASPEQVERLVQMVRATQPQGYIEGCIAVRDMDLREVIGQISAPTLVIAGTRDVATPIEHAEGLTARIGNADMVVLDASHLSNVEQATDFNEAVLGFLRD